MRIDVPGSSQVISSMEDTEVELECESIDLLVLNRSETSRRGWIFQERLLSNRILHMDSGQWYWQCDNTWVSEWRPDFSGPSPTSAGSRSARRLLKDGAAESASLWTRADTWQQAVESYSKTLLTFEKDKLIAIAGVAKQFQHPQLGGYCAGLWRNSILFGLTWQCHRSSFHPLDSHLPEHSRHAPSWSWAAVNKSVAFGSRTLYDSEAELLKSNDRVLELVDIHCVSTTPLAEDPFGEVVGGQIELSGWLLPQRTNQVLELTDSSDNDSFSFPLKQGNFSDVLDQSYLFDSDIPYSDDVTASFDRGVPPSEEVYMLPLYWVSSWGEEQGQFSEARSPDFGDKIERDDDRDNIEIESERTTPYEETPNRWIFLLGLLLRPLLKMDNVNEGSNVRYYERVGALNDWIDPSDEAFGAAISLAMKVFWDPVEKQARPATEQAKTRICIL